MKYLINILILKYLQVLQNILEIKHHNGNMEVHLEVVKYKH
jgi:hypothetical protein